jgi:hypothetical protein
MDVAQQLASRDSPEQRPFAKRLFKRIGTAIILIAGALSFVFTIRAIVTRDARAPDTGWEWRWRGEACVVARVNSSAPAGTLVTGDHLISVNGRQIGWLGPPLALSTVFPGQQYTVVVRRGRYLAALPLTMSVDFSIHRLDVAASLLVALLLFLAGLWIWLSGPSEVTAKLASFTFLVAAIAMLGRILVVFPAWSYSTEWVALALAAAPRPWELALGWDFLSRFPEPVPEGALSRAFRRILYAAALVFWISFNLPVYAELARAPHAADFASIFSLGPHGRFGMIPNAAFEIIVCVGTGCVLLRNYLLRVDRDSRRRILWAALSFALVAISLFLERLLEVGQNLTGSPALGAGADFADATTTVSTGFVPVVLAYTIVKHRVLGVRLVIRRGLQYLLAKNILRAILLVPVFIVLADALRQPNRSLADLVLHSSWLFYALVMGTAASSLRYRRQLTDWLDRRFFRIALKEEQTWLALIEDVKNAESEDEIAAAVAHQVNLALPVEGVHVFFRTTDGILRVSYSFPPRHTAHIQNLLAEYGGDAMLNSSVFTLSCEPKDSPMHGLSSEGKEFLVVPIVGSDGQNLGALVLAPKKSEQPYSRRERELLQAIAAQVVLACEVLQLKRSADQESRERVAVLGRLDRENIQLLNECPECGRCYESKQSECSEDGRALELKLPVERVIATRYRLDQRLGAGGMGVVYRALDLRLNRTVAVKIMIGELFGNRSALARFTREAQAVAGLHHPNIISVHDFGRLPAGGAFLVMDLVSGISWRKHLRSTRVLSPARVAGWIEQLCSGVAAAHAAGIIHRDLKPENVMIAKGADAEVALILDFGLAKWRDGFERESSNFSNVSLEGTVLGTDAYMSPEQRAGGAIDMQSDLYSIAVMTLETLARRKPPNIGATQAWISESLARVAAPDSELEAILSRALAEDPAVRMKHVLELQQLLPPAIRCQASMQQGDGKSDDSETLRLGAAN